MVAGQEKELIVAAKANKRNEVQTLNCFVEALANLCMNNRVARLPETGKSGKKRYCKPVSRILFSAGAELLSFIWDGHC